MKSPQGFGKKYFTLSSIQAHSVAVTLHGLIISTKNHLNKKLKISSQDDEDDELSLNLQENVLSLLVQNKRPSYCDGIYQRKTSLTGKFFKFITIYTYYTIYFAIKRTLVNFYFYSYLYNKLKIMSFKYLKFFLLYRDKFIYKNNVMISYIIAMLLI